ncbi:hypothetical protein GGR57DRAFT_153892 [Xylariaceae sp. FL1272]|nr:hypothetical protein GGR57DRAFT_153892 [Xylariaceae sp. FL1272]
MSVNRNPDAVFGREVHDRIPPSEPLTTKGHKPGVLTGKDRIPEFHAETHPPGTAPPEHTFQPQPRLEDLEDQSYETTTSAADTLSGSSSADLNHGYGKPMQGQNNRELHGAHLGKRKKERSGLEGTGASAGVDTVRLKGADLPEGVYKGVRGHDYPVASERVPTRADSEGGIDYGKYERPLTDRQ